ncbi:MAG: hypothetical protein AAF653_18305, partial [Chloroflexota bacterium]
ERICRCRCQRFSRPSSSTSVSWRSAAYISEMGGVEAAERQLTDVLEEGLENRWQRHLQMRSLAHQWVNERGFGFFAAEGYRSPTVTCVQNTREIDVMAMANFMDERGFAIDKGYGKIKGKTFRIAHMGDVQVTALEEYLAGLDEFLGV